MWPLHILAGSGALALIGIGLSMARFDEYRAAYWLFVSAGAVASVGELWWGATTGDPIIVRMMSGAVTGIAVFVILPMLFSWLSKRENEWASKKESSLQS